MHPLGKTACEFGSVQINFLALSAVAMAGDSDRAQGAAQRFSRLSCREQQCEQRQQRDQVILYDLREWSSHTKTPLHKKHFAFKKGAPTSPKILLAKTPSRGFARLP